MSKYDKDNPCKAEYKIHIEKIIAKGHEPKVLDKILTSKDIIKGLQSEFGTDNFPNEYQNVTGPNIKEFIIFRLLKLGEEFQKYINKFHDGHQDEAYAQMLKDNNIKVVITRLKDNDGKRVDSGNFAMTNFSERIQKIFK